MVVVLEAVSGPVTGRRIEVRAGSIVRIGRTAKSDYAIGEDSYLSSTHFAVECDGAQCRVRDLGSSNGTFVNGSRVTDEVVKPGDSVVAGGSTFTVHIDKDVTATTSVGQIKVHTATAPTYIIGHTRIADKVLPDLASDIVGSPVASAAPVPKREYSSVQTALLQMLFSSEQPVFAVLDASRDSRIPAFLDASGETFAMLDPAGRAQSFVVALPRESRLLDVLVKDGWSRGWGFYTSSLHSLEQVHEHLSGFVNVLTAAGAPLTMRFWDPRVLRALVPLMPLPEAQSFFGPLSRIVVETEKPEMALELTLSPRGPQQRTVILA